VESLSVLEQISLYLISESVFKKHNILTRVIVLLEEGLQLKSEVGFEQAVSAIKILRNFAKICPGVAPQELHNFGAIQTLAKCFYCQEKKIRRISLDIFSKLNITDDIAYELAVS